MSHPEGRMSPGEICAEFAHWTFNMPGFKLSVEMVRDNYGPRGFIEGLPEARAMLVAQIHTQNSYHPEQKVTLTSRTFIPYLRREHFGKWLQMAVHDIVTHEADEWLERDGVKVFDPHRNEK